MALAKDLLIAGKEMSDLARAMYLPMNSKQKNEYMKRVEERKDFYQPRIEEKTGVQLGNVTVLPNMLWVYQEVYGVYVNLCNLPLADAPKKVSRFEKEIMSWVAPVISIPIAAVLGSAMIGYSKVSENTITLAAGENCIRVPFGFSTRMDLWRKNRGKADNLDEAVIHELSHMLWDKLEEKNKPSEIRSRELSEGFATYCHEDYFANIYPKGYEIDKGFTGGIYKSGKRKIQRLVAKHGEDVVLQIPTKWPELLRENPFDRFTYEV